MTFVRAPRLKKGYHQILEANLQPKNTQRWPQVFLALTPSVKRAFNKYEVLNLSGMYLLYGPGHLAVLGYLTCFHKPKSRLIRSLIPSQRQQLQRHLQK
jgi:hypothetical protein